MHSIPKHTQATHTSPRAPTTAESASSQPHQRHTVVRVEAASKSAALESASASASASATDVSVEHWASSPSHSTITIAVGSPQSQHPDLAPAVQSKVRDDGGNGVSREVVEVATPSVLIPAFKIADTVENAKASAASDAPQKEAIMTAEIHRDKRIVISRPSSMHVTCMTDLTRPSDAYKVALRLSRPSNALTRRSRQPRKVVNVCLTKYPLIRKIAEEMGFEMETTEDELNEYKFNLCWSDTVLSLMRLVRLRNWQRTNHFPSMYLLCRKGHLSTTLGKMRRKLPSHFAYYPRTWSMRSERMQLTQYMAAVRQRRILKYFILKPNSGCQGRGIVVARDPLTALDEHILDNYIVQEYVHRPLLLEGKKFDLRVYVLLTSIRHPSIFLFNDGLVRICTEPYETPNEENVKQACKHLTNYAVNKKSSEFVFNTNVEHMDVGNKRNFGFLNRWLAEGGHSPDVFWNEVGFIVVKTILAAQPLIAKVYDSCFPTGFNEGYCCFEVLGFDILIDNKMKPWLMEVNHTPSFATETPLDYQIKSKLISEVWSIIDCKVTDYERDRQRERDEFAKRNMPPWASNHPLYGSQLKKNTSRGAGADGADSPDHNPATTACANAEEEVPPYVHARRNFEDTKLKNFKRIYPSPNSDVQLVYDTIQSLATLEFANSRLYYNSTVAAPVPVPMSSPPSPGVRTSSALPFRVRPPLLGPLLTASRNGSSNSSPSTVLPPRTPATLMTPNTTSAAQGSGAAGTATPIAAIPAAHLATSGQTVTSPSVAANNASAPAAPSVTPTPLAGREGQPAPATIFNLMEKDILRRRRSSDAPSSALALSHTSTTRSSTTPSESGGTATSTPAAAQSPHPLRTHTPQLLPTHVRTNSFAEKTLSSSQKPSVKATAADDTAASRAKPRVAEVHRLVTGSPPTMIPTTIDIPASPSANDGTPASNAAAMPASEALQKMKPMETDKPDDEVPSLARTVAPHPAANGPIHISRHPTPGQKLRTPSPVSTPNTNGRPRANSHELSSMTCKSVSVSGSTRDLDLSGVAHSGRRSQECQMRSILPHQEPTEEELARLATLQAMLDYEAAADPQPDDDDDDYNLTE
ncbi:tubulin-tyrsoine ligase-like protein [Leishmania major strain Friedlin]|uniref:Tubulin-tyrsoine ligase-like protein n=1 Tax=Leishmania major TaxID=5664 RepID=Q4QH40_LEIMA|nr:tubulin-tyrsoine ligase-like protein [Leishmania major strain Friedlin]CAG9570162.1 tubulin-tyrsoine_ligase-like_protein [Leishmania major strain Friedlin]CAJ02529.1 tubulin-tyrsoine ligase-like protein [Leishmania major strain Friedlin]|eukprot:XP_001681508.1 tubulin-tyrsoine ligase-like protein [Leishmania major strain Friedlin]